MPNTSGGLPYPAGSDAPDVPGDMQALAEAVDTAVDARIAKSIVDAKGDLIVGTAADTVSRLAKGTDGLFLKADSSTATGLSWASPVASGDFTQVTLNSGTSWTVPAGVNQVDAILIGGGGGGAGGWATGNPGNNAVRGGGGGGAGSVLSFGGFPVTPASTVVYAIGAGGTAGNSATAPSGNALVIGGDGGAGGTTNFGDLSAPGGNGGIANSGYAGNGGAALTYIRVAGGAAGRGGQETNTAPAAGQVTASSNVLNLMPWSTGMVSRANSVRTAGGGGGGAGPNVSPSRGQGGGAGAFGTGGAAGVSNAANVTSGTSATDPGCGGGGGGGAGVTGGVTSGAGGAGAAGRIIIWYRTTP